MILSSNRNACPCGSGILFAHCCGDLSTASQNARAVISGREQAVPFLPTEQLRKAMTNIASSPDLFPANIDFFSGRARLVKMSPQWYEQNVFLDPARILAKCAIDVDIDWLRERVQSAPSLSAPTIFHTAFSGSTLLSKALSRLYRSLPIREPEALGCLMVYAKSKLMTDRELENELTFVFKLLARRYQHEQKAVIKTNDYMCMMLPEIVQRDAKNKNLFIYTPLREYVAACLKDETRATWIRDRYHFALPQMHQTLPALRNVHVTSSDIGKMIAVYWSFCLSQYRKGHQSFGDRIRSLEFNTFLRQPVEALDACARWMELPAQAQVNREQTITELFSQYSKDTSYEYNPTQRRNDIEIILRQNRKVLDDAETLAYSLLPWYRSIFDVPGNVLMVE